MKYMYLDIYTFIVYVLGKKKRMARKETEWH